MSEKTYVITFHKEDFRGTSSKRTITQTATNVVDLLTEVNNSWRKENERIVVDFIYSEADK